MQLEFHDTLSHVTFHKSTVTVNRLHGNFKVRDMRLLAKEVDV